MKLVELLRVIPDWQDVMLCREDGDFVEGIVISEAPFRDGFSEYSECDVKEVYEYDKLIRVIINAER